MLNRFITKVTILSLLLAGSASHALGVSLLLQDSAQSILINGIVYEITDRHQDFDLWDESAGGYAGNDFTGYYLGTVTNQNNDSMEDLENLIRYYLGDTAYSTDAYLKSDEDPEELAIAYDDGGGLAGEWSVDLQDGSGQVPFYAVKGAKEYAIYFIDQDLLSGDWTTAHLLTPNGKNQPGLSHLSVSLTSDSEPVPEPATLWLMALGLAIIAALNSKRFGFSVTD